MRDSVGWFFDTNGFFFPVDVFSETHAKSCGEVLVDQLKSQKPRDCSPHVSDPHLCSRLAYDLSVDPQLLDVVGDLIGSDILIWVSGLFAKEPFTDQATPWHRDLPGDNLCEGGYVTAWIALSRVTQD